MYEPTFGAAESLMADLRTAGWRARAMDGDIGALLAPPADLWAVDIGCEGSGRDPLLGALSAIRATVPLLVVADREHLVPCEAALAALHDAWPAPLQLLVRPYPLEELGTRMAWMVRERARVPGEGAVYEQGELLVDAGRHQIRYADQPVTLKRAEFLLLLALIRADGRVLSKGDLLDVLHPGEEHYDENSVKTHIRRLRVALEHAGVPVGLIGTARGDGYYLDRACL